ncbi:MAG: division plane positioning ATPase MipZ [Alphaproteobacteria bacterium]|nr:division plane positioning ATPase MipZ [Alphaproteobacteria bacterium]
MAGFPVPLIVVGNEKGGSGKTTVAIHFVAGLLASGLRVGAIDLDHRQRSFSHFFANRAQWAERQKRDFPLPRLVTIAPSERETKSLAEGEEAARLARVISELSEETDVIVVDCPGADTALGRAAHSTASVIVTPLNDSFVDFDLLAGVDPETYEAKAPSIYAEFVWESRKRHMIEKRKTIDWLVVRNRVSSTETRNQRRVSEALTKLSQRIGFRLAPGLSERVIYRELFPKGLTVLDLIEGKTKGITMAQVAARQEVRGLIAALRLPQLTRVLAAS